MKANRVLMTWIVAWCASPSTAGAQAPAAAERIEERVPAVGARTYSCVEPAEAFARRRLQDEPCRWPLYQLPATEVSPPLQRFPPPLAGPQAGHAMFWRFPVQPMGPHEAPRHSRR
jgi:hypothetical protein